MASQSVTIHFSPEDKRRLDKLIRVKEREVAALERIAKALEPSEIEREGDAL